MTICHRCQICGIRRGPNERNRDISLNIPNHDDKSSPDDDDDDDDDGKE